MAYDFLGLVNDVNRRLNEVELSTSNFATATGFYSHAKDAVNSSIRSINQNEFEWPFNHNVQEEVLIPGQIRYSYPTTIKSVDLETFRIKRDDTLSADTKKLKILSYEEYLDKFVDDEYNTSNTGIRTTPRYVFRTPDFAYGIYPSPDKAYTLAYEYFALPTDLVADTDVPSLPEQFRHIIVDGAMHYAYSFRGDNESSQLILQEFNAGIKNMRSIYINRYEYLRSTMIIRNQYQTAARV